MNRAMRDRLTPLLVGVVLAGSVLSSSALAESVRPTLLQRIRALINLNRPIAAGGSRSAQALQVCVITPRTEIDGTGQALALVPLPRPTILAAGPLNEVRIDRDGQRLWSQKASSTQAIEGPIRWPIEPIKPGEQLTLLLRPRGASGGDFAVIKLQGAPAAKMAAHEALISGLGLAAAAWLQAVEGALERDQVALAWALLFAPQEPRSDALDGLRREVFTRGCGD